MGQDGIWVLTVAIFLLSANHPVGERTLQLWTGFLVIAGVAMMAAGIVLGGYYILPGWGGESVHVAGRAAAGADALQPQPGPPAEAAGAGGAGTLGCIGRSRSRSCYKSIFVPAAIALAILLFVKSRRLFAPGRDRGADRSPVCWDRRASTSG